MQDTPGSESPTGPPAGGLAASGDTPVGTSVYIGNLSWATRWQALKDHMRQAGEVVHAEVFTESSGRSAGCGTVEFDTVEAATRAIATLNETDLDGRNIFVRVDREPGKARPRRSAPYVPASLPCRGAVPCSSGTSPVPKVADKRIALSHVVSN
jgi:RNA recognition motif-containing protein